MSTKFSNWLSTHKALIIQTIIVLMICGAAVGYTYSHTQKEDLPYHLWAYQHKSDIEYNAAKADLIMEVDSFIKSVAPESELHGFAIVEACDEYNIDIRFVLVQGWQESHFGTTGIASKSNRVFNDLTPDGKTAEQLKAEGKWLNHPDQSIRPFVELIVNSYIPEGGNEFDLYKKYVNKSGKRYASNPDYEKRLVELFDSINSTTNIKQRMEHYHKCKIAAGRL